MIVSDWYWLILIDSDSDWFWLILIGANWFWLILIDLVWCWLVLIDDDYVGWCCLMQILIDAIEWHMLEHTHGPWTSIIIIVIVISGKSWILQPHRLSSSAFTVTSVPRHLLLQCWWFQFKIYASVIHYWHRLQQDFENIQSQMKNSSSLYKYRDTFYQYREDITKDIFKIYTLRICLQNYIDSCSLLSSWSCCS